jgi:hypothetical protein
VCVRVTSPEKKIRLAQGLIRSDKFRRQRSGFQKPGLAFPILRLFRKAGIGKEPNG